MNYNCFMVNENTQWHNAMPFQSPKQINHMERVQIFFM